MYFETETDFRNFNQSVAHVEKSKKVKSKKIKKTKRNLTTIEVSSTRFDGYVDGKHIVVDWQGNYTVNGKYASAADYCKSCHVKTVPTGRLIGGSGGAIGEYSRCPKCGHESW